MTNRHMQEIIKDVVTIKKELIGIKVWKEEPGDVRKYEGKAFPGMCGQIGEVLTNGETFITDLSNQLCTGGVVATGVARPPSDKASIKIAKMHLELMKDYGNLDTALCYEDEMKKLIPTCEEKNAVVQVGLFTEMKEPDLVLIFCTPGVADLINRAYSYVTGKPIQGFGGNGGCPFAIQYPYVTKTPSFTYSDISWRKFVGLTDDELTISFPLQSLLQFIESLPSVAENYRKFGEGMKL
ncbi:MAG TPA: DUF169 domain-containing protein [Thermodesulfobacteriota bacterium]|nr:DUF169 domain-containing protein [Thermodesulfobacteriota bacterium]